MEKKHVWRSVCATNIDNKNTSTTDNLIGTWGFYRLMCEQISYSYHCCYMRNIMRRDYGLTTNRKKLGCSSSDKLSSQLSNDDLQMALIERKLSWQARQSRSHISYISYHISIIYRIVSYNIISYIMWSHVNLVYKIHFGVIYAPKKQFTNG